MRVNLKQGLFRFVLALPVVGLLGVVGCSPGGNNKECEVDNDCETAGDVCNGAGECVPRNEFYDCAAYEYNGQTYDCAALDRCTEQDYGYRLACCECDPLLCNPDPNCDPCLTNPNDPACKEPVVQATSCMQCHNGATDYENYSGTGMSNPHPFAGAKYLSCVQCHGGNGEGDGKLGSHVPPPPQIGDKLFQTNDAFAFFNRLTLTGLDKLPNYNVGGTDYTALQYLQFVNPGDLRVVSQGKACGTSGCHGGEHADWVTRGPLGSEVGIYSATMFTVGVPNYFGNDNYYDTASDYAFRQTTDPDYGTAAAVVGAVPELKELPEYAQFGKVGGQYIYNNPLYDANNIANQVYAASVNGGPYANQVIDNSELERLVMEAVAITCGDCHLGSAGANNRYGDFRSAGCTACHMQYSLDGRSRSTDPNVNKIEPANPDAIAPGERAHIDTHQIRNVAKILDDGTFVRGINDYACGGCHQGSNRTMLQYWGIRLDQNQDLANNFQYPQNPATFTFTTGDVRLFDPAVANATYNGRIDQQYILTEDYDNDGRDDTPPDVHYAAGLGCIDCHGSRDLHNGTAGDPTSGRIVSRQDQTIHIECESCHGTIDAYAEYGDCVDYKGATVSCAKDRNGNYLRHVYKDANNNYYLLSRVTGERHYIPQTKDTIYNSNKRNPINNQLIYSPNASYAMGRYQVNQNPQDGIGPVQTNPNLIQDGFSHTDDLDCIACHASWSNSCIGCHLSDAYDANPANYFFSNTTGERIVLKQQTADFTYISPIPFYLGVNSRGKITQVSPAEKMFFRYFDINGNESAVLAFTDRKGNGNNPNFEGRSNFPALSMNQMMPHSIRGKVEAANEGPRYCVACHLNTASVANFAAEYATFRDAIENNNYANLDFNLLQVEIGQNPGNQNNSPFFVHMAAGLGSGVFLFDANGCPVNPLDANANRQYCGGVSPQDQFDINNAVYDTDRMVEFNTGISNVSGAHPMLYGPAYALRDGALAQNDDVYISGPLGRTLSVKLADENQGLVLDSWIDANGAAGGDAANYIQ